MTFEHGDLKVGDRCEYCNVVIHEDPEHEYGDDSWMGEYRDLHCQGDQCTPHEPYECSHCMFDDCLKDGKSVNNFDPFVKEQYFTTSAAMAEHEAQHELEDVSGFGMITPCNGNEYGDIENVEPEILKLLQHGTLTEKGNPRKRR